MQKQDVKQLVYGTKSIRVMTLLELLFTLTTLCFTRTTIRKYQMSIQTNYETKFLVIGFILEQPFKVSINFSG